MCRQALGGISYALRSVRIKTDFHASVLLFSLSCLRLFPSYHIAYIRKPSTLARIRIIANSIAIIIGLLRCDRYLSAEPVRQNARQDSGQPVNIYSIHFSPSVISLSGTPSTFCLKWFVFLQGNPASLRIGSTEKSLSLYPYFSS